MSKQKSTLLYANNDIYSYKFVCVWSNQKATLLKMQYLNDQRHFLFVPTPIPVVYIQFFRCEFITFFVLQKHAVKDSVTSINLINNIIVSSKTKS